MRLHVATDTDFNAIDSYINDKNIFSLVKSKSIGGTWLIATDGPVRGCVWFFTDGVNAYIDYFVSDYAKTAYNLFVLLMAMLKTAGVSRIMGNISSTNWKVQKMAFRLGFAVEGDYKLIYHG